LAAIQEQFRQYNIPEFKTHLHEREAYKALQSFGGTVEDLDPSQVGGLENAIANAREYAVEAVTLLRDVLAKPSKVAVHA
jgi:chromosome partitioning protein